ncbi:MAG: esterase-like activity of phytase family protein, partial [Bacteroidota bacterium]
AYGVTLPVLEALVQHVCATGKVRVADIAETNPESIRILGDDLIIADEAISTTRLLKASKDGKLIEEIHQMSDIRHNSGFEGTCISENDQYLYFSMERPGEMIASRGADDNLGIINLYRYNFKTKEIDGRYLYPLHRPPSSQGLTSQQIESFRRDNGVTEILFYNDTTLLLLERAFLGSGDKRLHIRIYKTTLTENNNIEMGNFNMLEPVLLFNFYEQDLPFAIDNVEGMTFGPEKKRLFLIADDNFDHYGSQTTQIISLNVK